MAHGGKWNGAGRRPSQDEDPEKARVERAIACLSQRRRSPKLKDGLGFESAISIVLVGLPWAKAMASLTLESNAADGRAVKRRPAVRRKADQTVRHLRSLCVLLQKCTQAVTQLADPFNDPESLVVPLMSVLELGSQEEAHRKAFDIAAIGLLLQRLAEASPSIQNQNIGKLALTDFILELALMWIEITGTPPGKTKCQASTPFHLFCCEIIGADAEQDFSRQINLALRNLDEFEIKMVREKGYRDSRCDRGTPARIKSMGSPYRNIGHSDTWAPPQTDEVPHEKSFPPNQPT